MPAGTILILRGRDEEHILSRSPAPTNKSVRGDCLRGLFMMIGPASGPLEMGNARLISARSQQVGQLVGVGVAVDRAVRPPIERTIADVEMVAVMNHVDFEAFRALQIGKMVSAGGAVERAFEPKRRAKL